MKNYILILTLVFLLAADGIAQDVLHNYGNLKIHDTGAIGFHIDLINDGIFDDNLGLAGFYSDDFRTVSGAFRPIFYDMEIVAPDDLILDIGVGLTNNVNFVLGDVRTPRNLTDIHLDFISDAFYTGQTDLTKVDGYAAITDKTNFIFPIGDDDKLRPLELSSQTINLSGKSAYFFEDPNSPSTFPLAFDTNNRTDILTAVSTYEFWDLDADVSSTVKLTWDTDSNLSNFVDAIENLRITGWHTTNNVWEDLGGNNILGDFNTGEITSDSFDPANYSAITFASSLSRANIDLGNYLVTPDGDGVNDFLYFEAISLSPINNSLYIYNRWGRLVFSTRGYENNFAGISDNNFTISPNSKLPDGVYFYILKLNDINLEHQGYLAISN